MEFYNKEFISMKLKRPDNIDQWDPSLENLEFTPQEGLEIQWAGFKAVIDIRKTNKMFPLLTDNLLSNYYLIHKEELIAYANLQMNESDYL